MADPSPLADLINQSLLDIRNAIANNRPATSSSSSSAIVQWAGTALHQISIALQAIVPRLDARILALERGPVLASSTPGEITPGVTSTSQPPGRQPRCAKCHARGHAASACRTTNPAAMRKRVAQNSRSARDSRAILPSYPLIPHAASLAYTAPPVPLEFASYAADANELRRRTAQSRRDKRLRKRVTSTAV
jgi:hypothetical protein